jgi:hypothetical protein
LSIAPGFRAWRDSEQLIQNPKGTVMQREVYDKEVEVTVRLMSLKFLAENEPDYPAIVVTTLLNHRIYECEIYNQHGEELVA